ncbi:MAG: hypothetical protein A2330_07295 [Ignavibacteria bacterium RIFOXYB2_FULL_36_7]|nr:MAG: hypothetical protein A2330_07295 [Ignavibacteria bacterium RIFOXYB2_FULL_36_7]
MSRNIPIFKASFITDTGIFLTDSPKHIVDFTLIFNRLKKKLYNYVLKMTGDVMLTEVSLAFNASYG